MGTILLNRSNSDREENDYYSTPEHSTLSFLNNYHSTYIFKAVWEPACGEGAISRVLEDHLIDVKSSDLIDRGYGKVEDFLKTKVTFFDGSIITNPPFKIAKQFIEKALCLIPENQKVVMLLRLQFLESKSRKAFLEKHLEDVYVHSQRIWCAKNGDYSDKPQTAISYAWYVFSKNKLKNTEIHWL